QGKFAPHGARSVIAVELAGLIELQCGMHEYKQSEILALGPERLELRSIEIEIVGLGGDHTSRTSQLVAAARELPHCLRPAERVRMRGGNETAGVIAFSPLGGLVAQPRSFDVGAHPRRAGE